MKRSTKRSTREIKVIRIGSSVGVCCVGFAMDRDLEAAKRCMYHGDPKNPTYRRNDPRHPLNLAKR